MAATVCAFCNHANVAGSSFCNKCGASLQLNLCSKCDAINPRTESICHKCGAELASASSTAVIANDLPFGESVCAPASTTATSVRFRSTDDVFLMPAPEARAALPLQRRGAAFIALPLIAVAAAVYYAYHNRDVVPPESSSVRHSTAITQGSPGMSASEVRGSKEPQARSETMATNSADTKTELPSVLSTEDGPAQAEPATAESKPDNAPASESSPEEQPQPTVSRQAAALTKSTRDGPRPRPKDRDGSVPASKSATGVLSAPPTPRLPTPGVATSFQPPTACSEAVAALGLCKRNNPDEGK
jgi:Double zinc ribbon